MSNSSDNAKAIDDFRKELKSMFVDIEDIDKNVLTKSVNVGQEYAKDNTKAVTGYMRRNWFSPRLKSIPGGIQKEIYNSADYASFVNDGHRIVSGKGETVGFVNGKFILEKTIDFTEKAMLREFKKQIDNVRRKHND